MLVCLLQVYMFCQAFGDFMRVDESSVVMLSRLQELYTVCNEVPTSLLSDAEPSADISLSPSAHDRLPSQRELVNSANHMSTCWRATSSKYRSRSLHPLRKYRETPTATTQTNAHSSHNPLPPLFLTALNLENRARTESRERDN